MLIQQRLNSFNAMVNIGLSNVSLIAKCPYEWKQKPN